MNSRPAINLIYTTTPRKAPLRVGQESPQCRRTGFYRPSTPFACCARLSFSSRQWPPTQLGIRHASTSATAVKPNRQSPLPRAKPSVPAKPPTTSVPAKSPATFVPAKSPTLSLSSKSPTTSDPEKTQKTHIPTKSSTSSVPLRQTLAKLNPPNDTYPPPLTIPTKNPTQSRFAYIYQCGKLYVKFYKQGIQNVRSMAQLAKKLRKKQNEPSERGVQDDLGILTRAEWQVVRRSQTDMLRLPVFGILLLAFGEWLPVLVLYVTPLIPEPCRIPAQIARTLRKTETRRRERERRLAVDTARLVARDRKPGAAHVGSVRPQAVDIDAIKGMDLYTLLCLSSRLDCHSGVWDRLFWTPPKWLLRWAVKRRLEYLQTDDRLMVRDGGWQGLNEMEVRRACVERGIYVLGRDEGQLRRDLAAWFKK